MPNREVTKLVVCALWKEEWRVMQNEIGPVMGWYPMPTTLVGTVLENGKANFLPFAQVGVMDHGHFSIRMDQRHKLDNAAIEKNGVVSVGLVNQEILKAVDDCGLVRAGKNVDKSDVFPYHFDELEKAPVVENAPVCMTCKMEQVVRVDIFYNFVLKPVHTCVQEENLDERGKIGYEKGKPVLFEFQSAQCLSMGKVLAPCWNYGRITINK